MSAIPWDKPRTKAGTAPPGTRCWCGARAVFRCDNPVCEMKAVFCVNHFYIHSHTSDSMKRIEAARKNEHARLHARQAAHY